MTISVKLQIYFAGGYQYYDTRVVKRSIEELLRYLERKMNIDFFTTLVGGY